MLCVFAVLSSMMIELRLVSVTLHRKLSTRLLTVFFSESSSTLFYLCRRQPSYSDRRYATTDSYSLVTPLTRTRQNCFVLSSWRCEPGLLTLSAPDVPNCCRSKGSAPYWSNLPFLISDIRALWRSVLSARVPECQKLKMLG